MGFLSVAGQKARRLRIGSLTLDFDERVIRYAGDILPASPAEFDVLKCLATHRNVPLSKEHIAQAVFGSDHDRDPRQIDVFVARLRRSLMSSGLPEMIATVAGRGYAVLSEDTILDAGAPPPAKVGEMLAA